MSRAGAFDLVVTRWGARMGGRRMACAVGRGGVGAKRGEGDGVTPVGRHKLVAGFWRGDRMERPESSLPLFRAGPRDVWFDDPLCPAYNMRGRRPTRFGHERLMRGDGLYDLALVSDFNADPVVAGGGSAIFVHVWRRARFPTAGCVAFALPDLLWIARNWRPRRSRLVIQG